MLRIVTFKLEEELLEKIDRIARRYGRCRSEIIRIALKRLVEEEYGYPLLHHRVEKMRIY